jgi:hypothetical protein
MNRIMSRLALGAAAIALTGSAAACGSATPKDPETAPPAASSAPSPASSPSAAASAAADAGGSVSGKTAQNAKFTWTASTVSYTTKVVDSYNKEQKPQEAGNRFCLVTTKIKNLSSDIADIAALDFKLIDSTGNDTTASGLLTGDPSFPFATQSGMESGAERTVQMVFEVPKNATAKILVVGVDFDKPGSGLKIPLD